MPQFVHIDSSMYGWGGDFSELSIGLASVLQDKPFRSSTTSHACCPHTRNATPYFTRVAQLSLAVRPTRIDYNELVFGTGARRIFWPPALSHKSRIAVTPTDRGNPASAIFDILTAVRRCALIMVHCAHARPAETKDLPCSPCAHTNNNPIDFRCDAIESISMRPAGIGQQVNTETKMQT